MPSAGVASGTAVSDSPSSGASDTIVVQGLSRAYGDLIAVDAVSFSVKAGEIFGLLGPNGAGKTTTVRILTGQLRPTFGRAWVAGCDVVAERERLKPQIGVVFEQHNLYARLSARGNLRFFARLYRVRRERVDRVLGQVGLTPRADDRVASYSNGMMQRLLIARALLHGPAVLFLDEPTGGLDPVVARDIRAIVANLARSGVTVFLTTHHMEEADQLCDRVAILDHGRIVALDAPARLKVAYGAQAGATLEDAFVYLTGRQIRCRSRV
jgi:ABC-2 type transport system ATP-binding protein